jgi:uncharacterized membrane protein (UPF0182 family)
VMEDTLEQALDRLFPGGPAQRAAASAVASATPVVEGATPAAPGSANTTALAAQARDHYQRALQAQRDGNWALYGEEIKRLGEVLERLSRAKQ